MRSAKGVCAEHLQGSALADPRNIPLVSLGPISSYALLHDASESLEGEEISCMPLAPWQLLVALYAPRRARVSREQSILPNVVLRELSETASGEGGHGARGSLIAFNYVGSFHPARSICLSQVLKSGPIAWNYNIYSGPVPHFVELLSLFAVVLPSHHTCLFPVPGCGQRQSWVELVKPETCAFCQPVWLPSLGWPPRPTPLLISGTTTLVLDLLGA